MLLLGSLQLRRVVGITTTRALCCASIPFRIRSLEVFRDWPPSSWVGHSYKHSMSTNFLHRPLFAVGATIVHVKDKLDQSNSKWPILGLRPHL